MSENIYAAPLSSLEEQVKAGSDSRFYVVSTRKLLVLYFLTLGLYLLYWNYKNWALHNKATDEGVWPIPRAIFSVFTTHALYHNVEDHDATGERGPWNADKYASIMVILLIVGNVLDRLSWKGIGSPVTDILSTFIMLPTGLLLKKVQVEINARCGDPTGSSNASFSWANIAWCVTGGVFWAMAILSLLVNP